MTTGLWRRAATVFALVLLAGCGGSENAAPGFDLRAEYAKVRAARARLDAARERLARTPDLRLGTAGATRVAASGLSEAQSAFDDAYARNQKVLARFLSVALNAAPDRPETRQALDAFAADAVANARYVLDHGADRRPVAVALARAERAYQVLGLAVPRDLAASIEELRRTPPTHATPSPAPTAAGSAHPAKRRPYRR